MICIPWQFFVCGALGFAASFLLPPSDLSWPNLAGVGCLLLAGYISGLST